MLNIQIRKKLNFKKILKLFIIAVLVIGGFFGYNIFIKEDVKYEKILIADKIFNIYIADSIEERFTGLSLKSELCGNCGMLFVFAKEGRHAFWMKDMKFPLDIIYLKNGKIVLIEKNIPANSPDVFGGGVVSDKVLELNAGMANVLDLKVGDQISL